MYCQQCRYVSFDHLDACPKCGQNWAEEKKKLGIEWLSPAEKAWLDPGWMKSAGEARDESLMQSGEDEFVFPEEKSASEKDPGYPINSEEETEVHVSAPAGHGGHQETDPGLKSDDSVLETGIDFSLDFSEEAEEKTGDISMNTGTGSDADAKPGPDTASDMEPDLDIGLEPDLDFPENADKGKKSFDLEQELEIDYPDLEFIESKEKDK